jgi:hypothetical protein
MSGRKLLERTFWTAAMLWSLLMLAGAIYLWFVFLRLLATAIAGGVL